MRILSFSQQNGDVRATAVAEAQDIALFGGDRPAIEACVRRISAEKGTGALALARITRMSPTPDGGVEFDLDAAIPPQVDPGKYLGIEVYVPADREKDFIVLQAAAEGLRADIPETYICRKTDGLIRQRMEDIMQRPAFGTLADIYAIMKDAANKLGAFEDGELWDKAVGIANDSNGGRGGFGGTQEIIDAVARAMFPDGAEESDREVISACLDRRAAEKRSGGAEKLMEESFRSYLRLAGKTEEELREDFRAEATELVRIDLLIDEVVRREGLTLSDEELDAALEAIANMYSADKAEVLEMIGEATLRAQLVRDKARAMIVDSAVTI